MDILKLGMPELRQKALPVSRITPDYELLAQNMLDTLHKYKGAGLAGPQVGVLERIYVIHLERDKPLVFINPSITETSPDTCLCEEGCLSIPGFWGDITRPKTVRVQAWNEKGRPFTLEASGLLARVIQHEYDHLEGVLYIDHLSQVKRERLVSKYERLNKTGAKRK
ncbi:MAG: peptide deformylase [Spirochaetaceae bacterium]|jgi:peptide deformylase|nr:peptide deformylase [Spirochaetaceae bacterium]